MIKDKLMEFYEIIVLTMHCQKKLNRKNLVLLLQSMPENPALAGEPSWYRTVIIKNTAEFGYRLLRQNRKVLN